MYHDAPEVTPTTGPQEYYQAPEPYHQPPEPYHQPPEPYHQPNKHVPITRQYEQDEGGTPPPPTIARSRPGRKGVRVYGVIIFLVAAVIGLAVATGLGMKRAAAAELRASTAEKRASAAEEQLSSYGIPTTTTNDSTTSTTNNDSTTSTTNNDSTTSAAPELSSDVSFGAIDKGCSSIADTVNGTLYTTPVHKKSYRILCNADAPNTPLLALLVADFDHCMYACASYTKYMPGLFPDDAEQRHKTCAGVTFVPAWTEWEGVLKAGARGNCYLKQGPMDETTPYKAGSGARVHSAYAI